MENVTVQEPIEDGGGGTRPSDEAGWQKVADPRSIAVGFSRLTREHPALVLSAAYLSATGLGMLSSWTFYDRFGLNVFHYAQLSDFILSAVRNPLAALAILLAVPAVWTIMRTDQWMTRFRWYNYLLGPAPLRRLSRTRGALLIYLSLYGYVFSLVYSAWMETRVRAGEVTSVEAQLQQGTYRGRDATVPFRTGLLGTTTAYVFLYDNDSGTVTVVPVENLALMTVRR